jgi:hypothetical protein
VTHRPVRPPRHDALAAPGSPDAPGAPAPIRAKRGVLVALVWEIGLAGLHLTGHPTVLERRISLLGVAFGAAVLVYVLTEGAITGPVHAVPLPRTERLRLLGWLLLLLTAFGVPAVLLAF